MGVSYHCLGALGPGDPVFPEGHTPRGSWREQTVLLGELQGLVGEAWTRGVAFHNSGPSESSSVRRGNDAMAEAVGGVEAPGVPPHILRLPGVSLCQRHHPPGRGPGQHNRAGPAWVPRRGRLGSGSSQPTSPVWSSCPSLGTNYF